MDDFNLPDIEWGYMHCTSQSSETLADLILNFSPHKIVVNLTRINDEAKSIPDLILISDQFTLNKAVVNIIPGIYDHHLQVCRLQPGCGITPRPSIATAGNFHKADDGSILTYLGHEFDNFSNLTIDPPTDITSV